MTHCPNGCPPSQSPGWFPVTRAEFLRRVESIDRHLMAVEESVTRIGERLLSAQDDIDAVAQAINDLSTKVTAEDSQLQGAVSDIQAWITAHPDATDLSGLQSAVSGLSNGLDSLAADVQNAADLVPASGG